MKIKQTDIDIDGYPIGRKLGSIKQGDIKLTDEQRDELISLGLDLITKETKFPFEYEDFKNRIIAWKERNGNLNIKYNYTDIDGYPIGQKLMNIKQGNIKLTDAQRDELIALGLNLSIKEVKFPFEFKDFKQRIIDWKEREGDLKIKKNALDIDGYPISEKLRNIKQGIIKLTDEQRDELISLGLDLTVKKRKNTVEDSKESGSEINQ